ncbi:MAG: energy-coupling factor ABC transporter permease [Verrucomicrobia bacterium]|nr:energy-coupling factor ABC transporter permease [Verrucomicrobiota bacterium]MBU1734271.1 energy-coupling factor ABC transporter permease [Verrucomicrobiota bacterium]MBU1855850.1 energy-coupling factor ABC transporter permease [Verrucomicrobiota bacterium]
MHMADALINPAVGGTMWLVTAGLIAYCARKVKQTMNDRLVPMMGVLGAFIFAAMMINFSIPGTGSSGHLGGGLILTILLGPYAAFLVISSVLVVQAFFFADGGLLALGCNIFNLGFFPAFIAYPFIYRVIARDEYGTLRAWIAAIVAAVVGLQLGAFGVVLETKASGISELPFSAFVLLMQPIHLAIGIVEGLATAAVVAFVAHARPEALFPAQAVVEPRNSMRPVLIGLLIATVIVGGAASWFASTHPDGLEWSIAKVSGKEEVSGTEDNLHKGLGQLQEKTAFLPDYGFKSTETEAAPAEQTAAEPEQWPTISAGTSVSGIVGGLITLGLTVLIGFALKARRAGV